MNVLQSSLQIFYYGSDAYDSSKQAILILSVSKQDTEELLKSKWGMSLVPTPDIKLIRNVKDGLYRIRPVRILSRCTHPAIVNTAG